jgi:hypothetical protein
MHETKAIHVLVMSPSFVSSRSDGHTSMCYVIIFCEITASLQSLRILNLSAFCVGTRLLVALGASDQKRNNWSLWEPGVDEDY